MTRYHAYVRVSTSRQEQGVSLDTQRTALAAYVTAQGGVLAHEWVDILSGTRDDRPRYRAMLETVQTGETIAVWRLDRIGRRKSELFRLFEWCKEHRVGLVSVTQPEMSNELLRDFMSVIAAWESQQIAERVVPNMEARVSAGYWVSKPPRWYIIGTDKRLAPAPDAADAQRAFEMFLATQNVEQVAVAFGSKTGTMRQHFLNRAYIGEVAWRGIVTANAHPAIVTRATWDAVNALLTSRRHKHQRARNPTALLTGHLYVADSARRMYLLKDKRSPHAWYATADNDGTLPRYSVRAAAVDAFAVDQLRTLTLTPATRRAVEAEVRARMRQDSHKAERAALARKLTALDHERVNGARLVARGTIDPLTWERTRAEREREEMAVRARLALLPPLVDPRAIAPTLDLRMRLAEQIDSDWRHGNIAALRLLIALFVDRVEVWQEPTDGKAGRASAYWREHPPRFVLRWKPEAVLLDHRE